MKARTIILLTALSSSACVSQPFNGQTVASRSAVIPFSGFALQPRVQVRVEASPTGAAPWTEIASTNTSASATPVWDGTQLYAFRTSAVVPRALWSTNGCTERQTFIRVRAGLFQLPTFDDPSIAAQAPLACMVAQQGAGATFLQAVSACRSPDSPVARIRTPFDLTIPLHVGDIVIDDATDVAAYRCLVNLDGNLTIAGPADLEVELLALETITGNLAQDYPRLTGTFVTARSASLPMLSSVGGDLVLTSSHPGGGSQILTLPLGMPSLDDVGGNVSANIETFNVSMNGLGSLTTLSGNLSVITGTGDTSGVFNALTHVEGEVFLDLGHTLTGILGNLSSVGGSFSLMDGNPTPAVLDDLTTVGGDFTIGAVEFNGPPAMMFFPSLASVGGRITVENSQLNALHFGNGALQGAALTVSNNAGLSTLGPANLEIIGSDTIEVNDNLNLCTSEIDAFLAAQLGWTGTSMVSGNGGC